MYTTRVLAEYVRDLHAGDLSDGTRNAAVRCVLDLMTAAVAGYPTTNAGGTRRVAATLFGNGPSAIWLAGDNATPAGAVMANSAAACALDLDDGNRAACGHPGAAVIPAAFAEATTDADALLTAIVAGYEVGVRLSAARDFSEVGVYASGKWCGYAAVAAAGYLRRTAPGHLSHAFAISGVSAPNMRANGSAGYCDLTGNDIKEGIPWGTVTGITALGLAEAGLTGPEDILDHLPHFDSRRILDGLGRAPAVEMTYFKPYSACRWIHAAVDAFEGLMARHSIAVDDIEAIDVHTFERAIRLRNHTEPETLIDVQYSVPYCVALAAVLGSAVMVPIGDDVLNRPEVSAVAGKVTLHLDPQLENRFPEETPARVIVTTPAGRFESPVTTPLGEPSNPMSWRALEDKFRMATRKVMDAARQEDMLSAVGKLAEGDASPLMKALETPLGA